MRIEYSKNKEEKIREGVPFIIKDINVRQINSAGGVDFEIDWKYINNKKVIKYIYFTVDPYNSVGDIQKCDVREHSRFTGQITGPIKGGERDLAVWETAWYNNTISCIKLTKVKVIYTDGTQYTYVNELPKLYGISFSNSCEY